jgi:hypothetical protein
MAAGEKEGKKPGREGEVEVWERRRWQKIGGGRGGRDRQLLGLGGDHVPFLGQLEIFWLRGVGSRAGCDRVSSEITRWGSLLSFFVLWVTGRTMLSFLGGCDGEWVLSHARCLDASNSKRYGCRVLVCEMQ